MSKPNTNSLHEVKYLSSVFKEIAENRGAVEIKN